MQETDSIAQGLPYLFAGNTLYDLEEEMQPVPFEGGNKKKILLLYSNPLTEKLSGTEKDIVERMLSGLSSSMEDIAIVNRAVTIHSDFRQLYNQFQFRSIILFGISPREIKLNIDAPLYQTIHFGNGAALCCESLIVIDKDRNIKGKFWKQFIRFFSSQEDK